VAAIDEPVDPDAGAGPEPDPESPDSGAESPAAAARRAYATAIRMLGTRDHSTFELTRKLTDRDFDHAIIQRTLVELVDARYVDDRRYACTYVEQRIARGYGPRAIESKLRERGIDGPDRRDAFEQAAPDWCELAEEAVMRKFRADQILDREAKAKARLARFLQGRGFSAGDSIRAIERARRAVEG